MLLVFVKEPRKTYTLEWDLTIGNITIRSSSLFNWLRVGNTLRAKLPGLHGAQDEYTAHGVQRVGGEPHRL